MKRIAFTTLALFLCGSFSAHAEGVCGITYKETRAEHAFEVRASAQRNWAGRLFRVALSFYADGREVPVAPSLSVDCPDPRLEIGTTFGVRALEDGSGVFIMLSGSCEALWLLRRDGHHDRWSGKTNPLGTGERHEWDDYHHYTAEECPDTETDL